MKLHEEIAKIAYELYQKSGYIGGRDFENWIDAERIVLTRHASQNIEEPEGEEPIVTGEELIEEVEEKTPRFARQKKEDYSTVIEEMEVQSPPLGSEEDIAIRIEKVRPKKPATAAAAKGKKPAAKKTRQKSKEKYL